MTSDTTLLSKWSDRLQEAKSATTTTTATATKLRTEQEELDILFEKYLAQVKLHGAPNPSNLAVQPPLVISVACDGHDPYTIAARFADLLNRADDSIWADAAEFTDVCSTEEIHIRIGAKNQPRLVETFIARDIPWTSDQPYEFFPPNGFLAGIEIPKGCGEFTVKYDNKIVATSTNGVALLQPQDDLTEFGKRMAENLVGYLHSLVDKCKYPGLNTEHLGILGARVAEKFALHLHSAPPSNAVNEEEKTVMLLRVLSVTTPSSSRTVRSH